MTSPAPGPADGLRLDYQQTTDFMRTLTDVRFKLLALVPTVSGAAVALLGRPGSTVQLLALGLLGLAATVGILLYELRNSQLHDYALRRAQRLEASLGVGLFAERPREALRLLGVVTVNRDRGLALVYSAALGGWCYLVAWGALRAAHVGDARAAGAGIALVLAIAMLVELVRVHERPDPAADASPTPSLVPGR